MANQRVGNTIGVTACNSNLTTQRSNLNGSTTFNGEHWDVDYASINDMRTRLAAISGTTYTAQRLNNMTRNDMVYAIRLNDTPTTIRA